jgi:uncharacterized protein YlxW (UPF0749 family)
VSQDPSAPHVRERALGGYDPHAGLNVHEAGQPRFNPVPSLLRSLLSDHLDPGYAAAAAEREANGTPGRRWTAWVWQAAAALLLALVFAAAVAQARSTAPGVKETQQVLANSVRASETTAGDLSAERGRLAGQVDSLRRSQLEGDAQGRELLGGLDQLGFPGATTKATGPGITVTISDPVSSPDLSDMSKERVPGSRQVVLDRDLQLVVNSLWASGAEAIAVGGVRVGPNVTIRQAGGAILVDNQPISSPYSIVAIGPPHALQDGFERSPAFQRIRLLDAAYGAHTTVTPSESLNVPAGSAREVKYAKPIGG